MALLSNTVVGNIRTLYASGLYHKADLAVRFSCYLDNPMDIAKILDYNILPDVRQDLQLKIFGMGFMFEASEEYHHTLRTAAIHESEEDIKDHKNAAASFQLVREKAEEVLKGKLNIINEEFNCNFSVFDIQSRLHTNL